MSVQPEDYALLRVDSRMKNSQLSLVSSSSNRKICVQLYQCCDCATHLPTCRNHPPTKTATLLWVGSGPLQAEWQWTNWDVLLSGTMAGRA